MSNVGKTTNLDGAFRPRGFANGWFRVETHAGSSRAARKVDYSHSRAAAVGVLPSTRRGWFILWGNGASLGRYSWRCPKAAIGQGAEAKWREQPRKRACAGRLSPIRDGYVQPLSDERAVIFRHRPYRRPPPRANRGAQRRRAPFNEIAADGRIRDAMTVPRFGRTTWR